ncbi:mitochondrial fission ELM1 family protein [Alkanindiges illinoisensis]|uniref:mitochondrial fission ELM1 family protein n=1 Tax=Alkanindiges illinoisensis TaxID=197183 RepID=UPI00047A1779|nr:ELM1/GtrOC1 family putative glycosyltransferase [Alkanindiges illinoisensis]
MQIWYISDGKAGHRAQMLGLAAGLKRQSCSVHLTEIAVQQLSLLTLMACWLSSWLFKRLPAILNQLPMPDLITGVGHRTHWKVLIIKKIVRHKSHHVKSLILMQPSLPVSWFDYLIIPRHDHPPVKGGILVTEGVLNPLVNEQRHQPGRNLILIGGPSKRHGWSEAALITQLQQVVQQVMAQQHADEQLILTTSRRTPPEFLQQEFLKQLSAEQYPQVTVYPVEQTPTGWLFEQLQLASVVWVTEDSVSMLYEALTAGCEVHLIQMPRLKQDRITCAVDDLLAQGLVKSLSKKAIDSGHRITLNEADRAARWLIHHLQG